MALQDIFYKLSRQEIAQIFKSPRAVQAYEKLQEGLSSDIVDAINQAQADADAAQVTADAAADDITAIEPRVPGPELVFVSELADLPTASAGVITLAANATYFFTKTVDLAGARLVAGQNTTILGTSSENARIKSTGLVGLALLTSAWTLPLRNITIESAIALDLDAAGNPDQALDWFGVNFTDCATVGTIANYGNVILTDCALINSANLTFDGTINTVGVISSLFSGVSGQTTVIVPATATIVRRLRIIYSAISTPSTATGISFSASASVPEEGYILDSCNFSGAGTYVTGVTSTSDKALFVNNVGITNTSANGQMYMHGNATATTVAAANTYYKVAGTTTAGPDNSKFTHSNNRLTYSGAISRQFLVVCSVSFTAGTNDICRFGFYASAGAAVRTGSTVLATANIAAGLFGRAESVTMQDIITMSNGQYIEVHCENTSAATDITVSDMNVTITQL